MSDPTAESYRSRIYRDYAASLEPTLGADDDLTAGDERFRHSFLPLLPPDRRASILDIGCGRGAFLDFLRREGYKAARGVDRSPEVVKRAQAAGLDISEGDIGLHLAAHPGAFDCVIAVDVFEHLLKPEVLPLLDAAYAALKPGGRFLIQTVNADGPFFGRMLYVDFTHETAFTRYSLYQVLRISGFERIEFQPMEPIGTGPRAVLRRWVWGLVRLGMGLFYHLETGSGIRHHDHILTTNILVRAFKPA